LGDSYLMVPEELIAAPGCWRVSGVNVGSRERGEIKGGRVGVVGEVTVENRNVDSYMGLFFSWSGSRASRRALFEWLIFGAGRMRFVILSMVGRPSLRDLNMRPSNWERQKYSLEYNRTTFEKACFKMQLARIKNAKWENDEFASWRN
jgi:hypothetical protein